jgi:C-terminal processing protease CtpA/Prc
MTIHRKTIFVIAAIALLAISCQLFSGPSVSTETPQAEASPTVTLTPTELPTIPVEPGPENPDEPVFITGDIPYTSPFFINTLSEPFVLLEDQAGFVQRNEEFVFPLQGQTIGAVEIHDDQTLTYSLSLPAVPQGTLEDLDNDSVQDKGVQVFQIAYWSNTWGGPFLEERDGTGWSNAYSSAVVDPERDNEIVGGILMIWSPDEEQEFPTGFGQDGLLFTEDDPVGPIPAGYSIVNLDQEPFEIHKEARPKIDLREGETAVNDYSGLSYEEAFSALFEKVSREYPFTEEKNIDWQSLYDQFYPQIQAASDDQEFYQALKDFTLSIPDAHVGISLDPEIFFEQNGGGFGLVLTELSDGRVIATQVFPNSPASQAGIEVGAEIKTWDGTTIQEAIDQVKSDFGPYSTEQQARLEKIVFLTRVPPNASVSVSYQNPNASQPEEKTLQSVVEYASLFAGIPSLNRDEMLIPIEGQVLDSSGLGYIRINTFSEDYNLMAQLWDHYLNAAIQNEIPGIILDVRNNSGGSGGLAMDFAGYFFDQEFTLYESYYYNDNTGNFELEEPATKVEPAPQHYQGKIAVLVSPNCVSACEGFTYAMTQEDRSTIVGHYPTAGAFGEVGRGQYKLPGDISMQFPTGRPETEDGQLVIEGVGVQPDVTVPVTEESALGQRDAVLDAAVNELLSQIGN